MGERHHCGQHNLLHDGPECPKCEPATDPYSVVAEILEYFDSYSLATWAPIAAIIERERRNGAHP